MNMLAPTPANDAGRLVQWFDSPEATGLLASIAKRPPLSVHFRDEWQQGFRYVGMRVEALRRINETFGAELLALCSAAYDQIGPDAPQAAVDAVYAPWTAYCEQTVEAVIDRALGVSA